MTKKYSFEKIKYSIVIGFAFAIATLSYILLPKGGLDIRDDILPSLYNWRIPWVEGTPLFPWAIPILMPLRFFSARMATSLVNSLSVILLALIVKKYKGNILVVIPIFCSHIGYWMFTTGQTDVLVFASTLLPFGFDLLLFWKPQVALHLYWVRFLEKPKTYLWFGATLLGLSLLIWGLWPIDIYLFGRDHLVSGWWNRAIWPFGIPIGLFFYINQSPKKMRGLE